MTLFYLVQHGEKQKSADDPGLTELGRAHAVRTAERLHELGIGAIYSSPLRRAQETAAAIAGITSLTVMLDSRLTERLNWDGMQPFEQFLAEWDRTAADRDFVPANGDSSRHAAERLRALLLEVTDTHKNVAVVTHGGVTVDLLRTLLGDDAVPKPLMQSGVPSCAVTTLDGLHVVELASTRHLQH